MNQITAMLHNHPLWGLLTLAVLAWYSSITVYVAIRGAADIKHMLRRLAEGHEESPTERPRERL